jgi:hypothetical protein
MSAPTSGHRVHLTAHPSTPPSDAVRGVEVRIQQEAGDVLSFAYSLHADLARVRIPPNRAAQRTDGLWKHTCFEAFVVTSGEPAYTELNFSPSSEWAAYIFSGYREGMKPLNIEQPRPMRIRSGPHGLDLHVVVRRLDAPEREEGARSRVGLAAVIEEIDGRISYWSIQHPAGKPDFHSPEAFALEL